MESPTDFLKTPANGRDDTSARSTRDHNNRGALLHLDGDLAGARAEYEAALAIDPDNVTALNNLGFLLAQDSQNEDRSATVQISQRRKDEDSDQTHPARYCRDIPDRCRRDAPLLDEQRRHQLH